MNWFLINCFALICLLNKALARSAPLEDGFLLRQIADTYSAPLVASFLHSRIQNTAQMVEDIKNSLRNLNTNQRNMLTLKVKSLEALDEQLTSLQKTSYFNMNGTERVKYLIEQYILNNEMFPIELKSDEGKFNSTPDDLLKQLNIVSNDQLINDTNNLINMHLKDIEEKESNVKYNQLQRHAASLAKRKLQPLSNFKYTEPTTRRDRYGDSYGTSDIRAPQIESVLRQFKNILDLFYPQFTSLASQNSDSPLLHYDDKASVQMKQEIPQNQTSSSIKLEDEFITRSMLLSSLSGRLGK